LFNYSLDYEHINFRENPEFYSIGRGEQGVLMVEPYKSEILPHWRFRTATLALESSEKIYQMFLAYKEQQDFVGMDMARKFLQMGYTRARRDADHKSGKKYVSNPHKQENLEARRDTREQTRPQEKDWDSSEKAEAARIFYGKYQLARNDPDYLQLRKRHKDLYQK
jgi:Domain of unknown function (DUF4385)